MFREMATKPRKTKLKSITPWRSQKNRNYYWHMKAENGEITAMCGETSGYKTQAGLWKNMASVFGVNAKDYLTMRYELQRLRRDIKPLEPVLR